MFIIILFFLNQPNIMTTAMNTELSSSRVRFAIDTDDGDLEASDMESNLPAMEESPGPTQLSSLPEQQSTNHTSRNVITSHASEDVITNHAHAFDHTFGDLITNHAHASDHTFGDVITNHAAEDDTITAL